MRQEGGFESIDRLELGSTECCALVHAFAKNPWAVSQLKKAVGEKILKQSADVLVGSEHLAFPRNEYVDLAYHQIAIAELARLMKNGGAFHCKHSTQEHEDALRSVVEKTSDRQLTKEN